MIIRAQADGINSLTLSDDKSPMRLMMQHDPQLDTFACAFVDGSEVEPVDPIRRRQGESDEVYFDRACAIAMRIYLDRIAQKIEVQSRYERMQPMIAQIRESLNHIDLVFDNWDNDEPSEDELERLKRWVTSADSLDRGITELS